MYHDRPMTRADAEWHADTLAGRMEEIERRIYALGAPVGLVAVFEQTQKHIDYTRSMALFGRADA